MLDSKFELWEISELVIIVMSMLTMRSFVSIEGILIPSVVRKGLSFVFLDSRFD